MPTDPLHDLRRTADRVRVLIDLTDLRDDHSPDHIDDLTDRARRHGTAAVCVWPEFVSRCARSLAGSDVRIATVVNFPGGGDRPVDVLELTRTALADGADEIDVVLPYRALLADEQSRAFEMVEQVRAAVRYPAVLKVILETGELMSAENVRVASQLAIAAGADFLKTSTGKTARSATTDAARVMLEEIAAVPTTERTVGLKPSGGIRTLQDAHPYLALADEIMGSGWASPATFRFGASGLLDDVVHVLGSARD